ncbi:MAG: hybrid sensor histidine kinase/response regulator [Burkholderiales bacterium]|nr:hybrid sensor histidine kinase/response regulator [Burkholderiales bacterium]
MNAQAADQETPDPEDGAHSLLTFLVFRGAELFGAFLYITAVPWWRLATWYLLVFTAASLRFLYATRPGLARRRAGYRFFAWLHVTALGSAAYFMYVPESLLMQTVLGVQLFAMAAAMALRLSGDFLRTAVGVTLVIAPAALRAIYEGTGGGNVLQALIGGGALCVLATIVLGSRVHERSLLRQYEQRRMAERAADAMAGVGLLKSRFFAAVSHDLRQPVHAIGLYLEPLDRLSTATGNEDARRAVQGIRLSWLALDGLLSQVLDLTRMDAGALEPRIQPVELAPLVRGLIVQHSASAERRGVRLVALAREGRYAMADELMLRRVISNLLDNAIKFSDPGATVAVAVRYGRTAWRLQVRDDGKGIPQAAQAMIFDEFAQIGNEARDRQQGYGLGLAISRRFTSLMQGSLTVRSETGLGCSMTVSLQRGTAPTLPEETPGSPEAGRGSSPSGTELHQSQLLRLPHQEILIVEDDLLVADAMTHLLRSWGQRVMHVGTAAEALAHSRFGQIAICDVRLPGGASGMDLALKLRRAGKNVLVITGETDAGIRQAADEAGLTLLIKPVSSAQLLKALRGAMESGRRARS